MFGLWGQFSGGGEHLRQRLVHKLDFFFLVLFILLHFTSYLSIIIEHKSEVPIQVALIPEFGMAQLHHDSFHTCLQPNPRICSFS